MSTVCPIWNVPAEPVQMSDVNNLYFDSSRAGGLYRINDRAAELLRKKNPTPGQSACLTTWLADQRKLGEKWPLITADLVGQIDSLRPLTTTSRIERALLYFNAHSRIGGRIAVTGPFLDAARDSDVPLMIETESPKGEELIALLHMLIEMGWLVERENTMTALGFALTGKGWLKIEELVTRLPDLSQAFVAMWFNPRVEGAYEDGIKPAIEALGYRSRRIDKKEHNNKIDDEIIAEIKRSKFLVADFTCETEKVRGGVYFEAGYAMALPIPVIWTCAQESINDLHFDTRQYNHIVWETPYDLRTKLEARIGAVVGDGPLLRRAV